MLQVSKEDVTDRAINEWNLLKRHRGEPLSRSNLSAYRAPNGLVLPAPIESEGGVYTISVPVSDSPQVRVEVSQHSDFPRDQYPTQPSPPCSQTSSEASRATQSWQESSFESTGPIATQSSAPALSSIPESALDGTFELSSDDIQDPSPKTATVDYANNRVLVSASSPAQVDTLPSPVSEPEALPSTALGRNTPPARQKDPSVLIFSQIDLNTVPEPTFDPIQSSAGQVRFASTAGKPFQSLTSDAEKTYNMIAAANGVRKATASSPPMQDRVRSIRNSALSSQPKRPNGDGHGTANSRASSVVSDAPAGPSMLDTRLEVRTTDFAPPYHTLESPTSDSFDASAMTSRHDLTLPSAGERNEYFISLPLPSRVRDQYSQTIQYFKKDLMFYLAGSTDEKITHSMRRLVQRLNNVSTHVDLENEPSQRQLEVPLQDEVKWALSSSSKFVFLEAIFKTLRTERKMEAFHIALVASQTRLCDILERFLQGIEVDYSRLDDPSQPSHDSFGGNVKVSIVAAQYQPDSLQIPFTDAIIMMDGTTSAEADHIIAMRSSSVRPTLSPVIYPVVYCSVEHLSRCIERVEDINTEDDKLRALMTAVDERQAEVGSRADEEYTADAAGEEVAYFLPGRNEPARVWTGQPVRPVKVTGLEQFIAKGSSNDDDTMDVARQHRSETPNIRKRAFEASGTG